MSGAIPDMTIRYRWAADIVCSAVEDGNGGMTMSGGGSYQPKNASLKVNAPS